MDTTVLGQALIEFMSAAESEPTFTIVGRDLADDASFVWIEARGPGEDGHGNGTRQPSRPFSVPPDRNQTGSSSTASERS